MAGNEPSTEPGEVTWHSSEEDGGPDVGLSMGLGLGRLLWVGERPGVDGWWLSIYDHDGCEDLARFEDAHLARRFFEELETLVRTIGPGSVGPIADDEADMKANW